MISQPIDGKIISPTCLNTYLRCQKRFYHWYVAGLKEPEEFDINDEIDNRYFGLIFHRAAELFYLQFARPEDLQTNDNGEKQLIHPLIISKEKIDYALKHENSLYSLVDQAFAEQLFRLKPGSKMPEYNGLQLINREVITSYLKQLLHIDQKLAPLYTIRT